MDRSTAACASRTTRLSRTRMSSVSAAAAAADSAASRITVRMVPSVGFMTARYAKAQASANARATPSTSTRARPDKPCARPRKICDRMTPLLPRAPISEPCAAAAITDSADCGCGACCASSTADRSVRYMFDPVSPSGTGYTLRSLISCWFASSQANALRSPMSTCSPSASRSGSRRMVKSEATSDPDTILLRVDALDVDVDRQHRQTQCLLHVIAHCAHQVVGHLADARAVLGDDVQLDDDSVWQHLHLHAAM